MDLTLARGLAVLTAIASGAEGPKDIALRLGIAERTVATHLDALVAAGFIHRDGDGLTLAYRLTSLLGDLAGRSDLVATAGPAILEAEARLGLDIEIEITDERDPVKLLGLEPFAVRTDARGLRQVVACVMDNHHEIACLLLAEIDGAVPEEIEILGKELAATAAAITKQLPPARDRDPSHRRPLAH